MKTHPWDPLNYSQYNRNVLPDRKLFPVIADCSHLTDTDEVYHLCETELEREKYVYEFIQCLKCITRHFIKFHRVYMRDSVYAEKIQDFMPILIKDEEE